MSKFLFVIFSAIMLIGFVSPVYSSSLAICRSPIIDGICCSQYTSDYLWPSGTGICCGGMPLYNQSFCPWVDCDLSQSACESFYCANSTSYWDIGFGDSSSVNTCCFDDTDDNKIISAYGVNLDNTSNIPITVACCDISTDCVNNTVCYASGSFIDVDTDSDNDYCLNSIWYDCNAVSECPPASGGCAVPTCSSNDCIENIELLCSLGSCAAGTYCNGTDTDCVSPDNYQLICESCPADQTVGDLGINWSIGGEVAATQCCGNDANEWYLESQYNDTLENIPVSTDACCDAFSDCVYNNTCYSSGTSGYDVDSDSDVDYCLNGKWYDCNTDSDCLGGVSCIGRECVLQVGCTDYCTNSSDLVCYSGCNGTNGCLFYNADSMNFCEGKPYDQLFDYGSGNVIKCCEGAPKISYDPDVTYAGFNPLTVELGNFADVAVSVRNRNDFEDTFTITLESASNLQYWSWFSTHKNDEMRNRIEISFAPYEQKFISLRVLGGTIGCFNGIDSLKVNATTYFGKSDVESIDVCVNPARSGSIFNRNVPGISNLAVVVLVLLSAFLYGSRNRIYKRKSKR